MTLCLHCAGGDAAVWQPHSREFVHRSSRAVGQRGYTFSITVCADPPAAPDGGVVRGRNPAKNADSSDIVT